MPEQSRKTWLLTTFLITKDRNRRGDVIRQGLLHLMVNALVFIWLIWLMDGGATHTRHNGMCYVERKVIKNRALPGRGHDSKLSPLPHKGRRESVTGLYSRT